MTNRYILSRAAENDIGEIIEYFVERNIQAAHIFVDSLYDTMDFLAENPEVGHNRLDLVENQQIKFWTFQWHYLIVYKSSDPVEIVRVLSGYRDIAQLVH